MQHLTSKDTFTGNNSLIIRKDWMTVKDDAIKLLQDEQFCLAFELETLSKIATSNQLERWVSGFSYNHTEIEHALRYQWACQFVSGRNVLDIACGTGSGSYTMAKDGNAKHVTGCDIDPKAIRYASIRNKHERLTFLTQNAETFASEDKYDVIVSFETIEHIANVDSFLEHIKKSLSATGQFIVSTPISSMVLNETPDNRHHVREWGFLEFQKIISAYFKIDNIYVQLYPANLSIWNQLLNLRKKLRTNTVISEPQLWSSSIPAKELGKNRNGYQILQCKS